MAKISLKYSKRVVNRAGDTLIDDSASEDDKKQAKDVLDNWRACHTKPLNTFQTTLRFKLREIDSKADVSQRLKRTPSIVLKLNRFNSMKLAQMQDIGGLRAVVKDIRSLRKIEKSYREGRITHELVGGGKDYVAEPQDTGYRGIHLVYKYNSNKSTDFNGLFIELQLRTQVQHCWATAVETMGTFLEHALKSSDGPQEWLDFFALTSSAFSYLEASPQVPKYAHMTEEETFQKLIEYEKKLDVINKLTGFGVAANHIENDSKGGSYHLVVLNLDEHRVYISSYGKKRLSEANANYSLHESRVAKGENLQVVLVASESIDSLKRAYPSYFLDTDIFTKQLAKVYRRMNANRVAEGL